MPRPKGSKNKPKIDKIDKVKPVEDSTLSNWNENIQKLNQMKGKEDWTEEPSPSREETCPSTEEQLESESEPESK